jgi:RNA 3'-terminal phosphate cyclase (ATP)
MLTIDGSQGEGGGQVLRTALALSLVTGEPFRIVKLRAGRRRPGLMRQHLTAVRAAAEVGRAEVTGAEPGSQELTFRPRGIFAGEHDFRVGTAGSATLVFQTVLPALLRAKAPSRLVLEGGTHNPLAPSFEFLARAYLPLVRRMGPAVDAVLERPGFYPAGGGRFRATVSPGSLAPLSLLERGAVRGRRVRAVVAGLPRSIAERELAGVADALGWDRAAMEAQVLPAEWGPGNVVTIEIECDEVTEVFTGFGEKGIPAERVAARVAAEAREYLESDAPVGRHLADQLLLPMVLAGTGSFRTLSLTRHATTQIAILSQFVPARVAVTRISEGTWEVRVGGS